MKLEGNVALVTGGGRGIGRAIALALGRHGADLVLIARTAAELDEVGGLARGIGRHVLTQIADVSVRDDVDSVVDAATAEFGRIDVLVNNAGVQAPIGPLVSNDAGEWVRAIGVNLAGPFHLMQAVLPGMMSRRRGKIVNVSGGGATAPRPCFSAYAASKAALVRLTETVAAEVEAYNIHVNAVAPGAVNTRMLDEVLAAGDAAGGELLAARERQTDGGTPAELVADLVVFLASGASDGLTGKLVSAPHDGWRAWDAKRIAKLNKSSWCTLRRLDENTVRPLLQELE